MAAHLPQPLKIVIAVLSVWLFLHCVLLVSELFENVCEHYTTVEMSVNQPARCR